MIKYSLICKKCEISFESWFASSKEYEKLKKKDLLSCISCNSKKIQKNIMAPRLLNNSKKFKNENKNLKMINISKKMREFQKFVKDNFNYVGDNFAYEARSIHYDKKKNKKGIYGKASINEVKELNEEGIETGFIPWLEEKNN